MIIIMIINENSWHVRMHDFFYWQRPNSLCKYFWKMAWTFLVIGVICASGLLGSWVVGQAILSQFGVTGFWLLHAGGTVFGVLIFATIVVIAVGIAYIVAKISGLWERVRYDRAWKRQQDEENGIEHPKSVIVEYLKASKSKICPMIEFKDVK